MGDSSDKINGIKGLGVKKLKKLFPELSEKPMELMDLYNISKDKYKDNVIYSRVVLNFEELEKNYKIMDLNNPFLDENDKRYLSEVVLSKELSYNPEEFIGMYEQDKLGGMIRNVEFWVKDVFEKFYK